jgi:uncharacterized protein (DUF427 family)
MDAWFEEDEQVFVHPRDPYTRVDTLHSSRHVRVEIDGVTMGETRRPMFLFETRLPTRYYIPKLDVRMDLLEPSESVTRCPYKGVARHWSAQVCDKLVTDIVWSYPAPIPECPKIENLLSFYNERVDLYIVGCSKIDQSRHSLNVEIGEVASRLAGTCIEGRADFVGLSSPCSPSFPSSQKRGMMLNPRLRQHGRRARRRRRSAFSASR